MKNVLLMMLILISTVVSAQKFKKLEINVGPSLFVPVTKDINWDDKSWGQRFQLVKPRNDKFSYTLTFGVQQSSDKFLQMPLLLGTRFVVFEKVFLGIGAGSTFFKDINPRFTLSSGIGVTIKRFTIEQSIFRTTRADNRTLDVAHNNNIGLSILYKL